MVKELLELTKLGYDVPELYDDMENLYQVYSRLGELEKIYWKKWESNDD